VHAEGVEDESGQIEGLRRRTLVLGWSAFAFGLVALAVAVVIGIFLIAWYAEHIG
jgi:hypothetical protein